MRVTLTATTMGWVVNKLACTILALAALAAPAHAADWIELGDGTDGRLFFIDVDSIRNEGNFAQAWVKFDYSKVSTIPWRQAKELWKFNCEEGTGITLSQVFYRADGTVGDSSREIDITSNYNPVVPESFGETAFIVACPVEH